MVTVAIANGRLWKGLFLSIFCIMLSGCASSRPSVRGVLLYDGKPADGIFSSEPSIWIRSEESKELPKPKVVYEKGSFSAWGLPGGEFGLNVNISETGKSPCCYPGDYNGWTTFGVSGKMTSYLDVDLVRIIHLMSPQDNSSIIPLWDAQCMDHVTLPGPVRFSWEPLGDDVYYDYLIVRVVCPYKRVGIAAQGSTTGTDLVLELPPSRENEFYVFSLDARKKGRRIGMLMTHGSSGGYGWDLRFRVK